jgi:ankyrin repeat protein
MGRWYREGVGRPRNSSKPGGNALSLLMDRPSPEGSPKSVLRLLLDAGIQINMSPEDVRPSLMAATWHGRVMAGRMLLDAGAEAGLKNDGGETGLILAAF